MLGQSAFEIGGRARGPYMRSEHPDRNAAITSAQKIRVTEAA
jgi:hypothetical protein